MGMLSVVLIRHDYLHLIEKDPEFGKKLANACSFSRNSNKEIGHGISGAMVIGGYFHASDTRIIVTEGNTAWAANWSGKPEWSTLTKVDAMRMLFGEPKPKRKGSNVFKTK